MKNIMATKILLVFQDRHKGFIGSCEYSEADKCFLAKFRTFATWLAMRQNPLMTCLPNSKSRLMIT